MSQTSPMLRALALLTSFLGALSASGCGEGWRSTFGRSPSQIKVTVNPGTAIRFITPTSEFELLPSGYLRATLLVKGKRLTLDEPGSERATSGGFLVSGGKEIRNFLIDYDNVEVSDIQGPIGNRGKRVEVTARSSGAESGAFEKTMHIEVYDDFPSLALTRVTYKNVGAAEVPLDRVVTERHRLNTSLVTPEASPHELWSFQGSSFDWGQDEVVKITETFSQANLMGRSTVEGYGGGIPVVAFWTASMGEALGHMDPDPEILSLPVKVETDGRIHTSMMIELGTTLKPGESYTTPRSFVAVYSGDFYEPLRLYSEVLQRDGWTLPDPPEEAYQASWCSWGYESEFTKEQILATIPKLKEFEFKWATFDYRWFDAYGDWNPRPDNFPGDSVKQIVEEFHRQGMRMQIWWQPLAVEDGQGKHSLSKPTTTAKLAKEHPDWLILDENGKHARMLSPVSDVAALCPALPEVQQYHRKIVERFIREWNFDGHKLDSIFTVPACYNPKHHHTSPDESIRAMREVYRIIFQTTRQLKPNAVTQICPCGTTPNVAWLPYMNQAVTADPVGSGQVRLRIKLYKALLGPQAAVYGDHVELSEIQFIEGQELDLGKDFASTVGLGGIVGTKFTWPDYGPQLKHATLTAEKELLWKKWIAIYNEKMLSRGTFLNLYTHGYDAPEGYAIEKNGKLYYAFYSPHPERPWQGEVELRGLKPGRYKVLDYAEGKDLGAIEGANPKLATKFTHHLLLEVSKF